MWEILEQTNEQRVHTRRKGQNILRSKTNFTIYQFISLNNTATWEVEARKWTFREAMGLTKVSQPVLNFTIQAFFQLMSQYIPIKSCSLFLVYCFMFSFTVLGFNLVPYTCSSVTLMSLIYIRSLIFIAFRVT